MERAGGYFIGSTYLALHFARPRQRSWLTRSGRRVMDLTAYLFGALCFALGYVLAALFRVGRSDG